MKFFCQIKDICEEKQVAVPLLPRMLERKAWFPKHGFFFFSWLKLSKSLAHLVRVTTLKKLSFVCPQTSSSEACFLRMSEPPLSQCQQMNLGDLRFSISFCTTHLLLTLYKPSVCYLLQPIY